MQLKTRNDSVMRPLLAKIGSMWFAGVILVLLMVGMGSATVFESSRGPEQALALFYRAWWFSGLLGLLAINMLAAVVVRFPFSRRQIGFVLTHLSILLVFGGAAVTGWFGIDGQVGLAEGQSSDQYQVSEETLTLIRRSDGEEVSVSLASATKGRFEPVDGPKVAGLSLDGVQVEVERYLPDSEVRHEMVNDGPRLHQAVEVSLEANGGESGGGGTSGGPTWVFADRPLPVSGLEISYEHVRDATAWARLLTDTPTSRPADSPGTLRIVYGGAMYKIAVKDALAGPVAMGETGLTAQVLRYLPHATVNLETKTVENVSNEPENPAVEVAFDGEAGRKTQLAFAKHPDYLSMHTSPKIEGLKLTFIPTPPIRVLRGPTDDWYVRFTPPGGPSRTEKLTLGTPIPSPWPNRGLTVHRAFDRARSVSSRIPVEPAREKREPAVLVRLRKAELTNTMWVGKFEDEPVTVDGESYAIRYADRIRNLGFRVELEKFELGLYPGTNRPRSFTSQVTIMDPARGRNLHRVISMNHPTSYGGFTFYQSSYRQTANGMVSFLSVSRDPGQPIVFAGYVLMMIGMVWVLVNRMGERRRMKPGD